MIWPAGPKADLPGPAARGRGLIPAAWADGDRPGAKPSPGGSVAGSLRENLRVEIQRPLLAAADHARNRWLAGLACSLELPLVATGVHSHERERA